MILIDEYIEVLTWRIIIWIMKHHSVSDPDVLVGSALSVSDGVVELGDHLLPLHHLSKHTVLTIQTVQVAAQGEEELGANHVVAAVDHADEAVLSVPDPGNGLSLEIASLEIQ